MDLVNVLQHKTIESLVREVAERKVESLSYSSYQKLVDFFEDRFSLVIVPKAKVPLIIEAIEIRNSSVHNRCVVNKRVLARTGSPESLLGKRKELGISYLEEVVRKLAEFVRDLDRDARKKLKLKGRRFSAKVVR